MAQIERETNKTGFLKGIESVFLKMKLIDRKKESAPQPIHEKIIVQAAKEAGLSVQELQEKNDKLQAQQKQADNFLNAQLPHLYFAMVDNGYQPTARQEQLINQKITSLISDFDKVQDFEGINKFIKCGYKLSPDNVYQIISSHYFQKNFFNEDFFNPAIGLDVIIGKVDSLHAKAVNLASVDNNVKSTIEKYSVLMNNIRETLFSEVGSAFIANKWLNILKQEDGDMKVDDYDYDYEDNYFSFDVNELSNIPAFLKHIPHLIMPHIQIDKYLEFMSEWQNQKNDIQYVFTGEHYEYTSLINLYTEYSGIKENKNSTRSRRHSTETNYKIMEFYFKETDNLLSYILDNHFSNDIKNLLDNTKATYANTYLEEKAIQTTQVLSTNYKVSSLPKNTQDTIQEIQSVYTALQAHKSTFSDEQKFLVENLFDKRIPEVLQKYFSIDKDYRVNMKNLEGKNAQDLMDESLTNFKNKLTEVLDNINAAKLSDLNVTKRYSKSI